MDIPSNFVDVVTTYYPATKQSLVFQHLKDKVFNTYFFDPTDFHVLQKSEDVEGVKIKYEFWAKDIIRDLLPWRDKLTVSTRGFEMPLILKDKGILFKTYNRVCEATITCWERVCKGENDQGDTYESVQDEMGKITQTVCTNDLVHSITRCTTYEEQDLRHLDKFLKNCPKFNWDRVKVVSLGMAGGIAGAYSIYQTYQASKKIWDIYQKKENGDIKREIAKATCFLIGTVACGIVIYANVRLCRNI